MFLERIGADACVRELFAEYEGRGLELGRMSFAAHERYRVWLESGELEAAPSGRLRYDETMPAAGDWVATRRADASLALIEAVLPRRTKFSRRSAGESGAEQVIAANLDIALVVCGLDGDFNLRRIERYLVLARESGAEAAIVLNKTDLCRDVAAKLDAVRGIASGVTVVAISARESVETLLDLVRGRTSALLGSSGAGKSTIVNALVGQGRQSTHEVRESDSRGRHTTTNRMLLPLPGSGAILDNPGMRELQLWASEESLDDVFHEIAALAENCRFGDCSHTSEPGCAVRGQIDPARWESYRKLQAELQRGTLEQKRRWKAIHRAMRKHPKHRWGMF
jgi:ribosome biogenesis GTPase